MTTRNPFPGMNPFLEHAWRDAHARLITYISDALQQRLPADLAARAEESSGMIGTRGAEYRADVKVTEPWALKEGAAELAEPPPIQTAEPIHVPFGEETERWIEIRETGGRLITVLELLSPANKLDLREEYLLKRHRYMSAKANLVEIDLIRQGTPPFPVPVLETLRREGSCYSICVLRAAQPAGVDLYPIHLRQPLPAFRVPLRETDQDIPLDLQPLIDQCHERGRYHLLDYSADPAPPFSANDAQWLNEILRHHNLRK